MRRVQVVLLVALASACKQENEVQKRDDVQGASDWARIVVTPEAIAFGALHYGESIERAVTITNEGTDNSILRLEGVGLTTGADVGFTVGDVPVTEEDVTLHYGDTRTVLVTFTTTTPDERYGQLTVTSDDAETPTVIVPLSGEGLMPLLAVEPEAIAPPETTIGCDADVEVTFTNVGNDMLDVADISNDTAPFTFVTRPVLPFTLAPGESASSTVRFTPSREGDYEGSLIVTSNDPRGAYTVPEFARGVLPGNYTDTFTVPEGGAVDLMLVVDQSESMDDDQATLATNALLFASGLSALTDDWQLMVVTADDGCTGSGILTSASPDFAATIARAVTRVGDPGYHTEQGLYLSYLATKQTHPFECNEGFMRDGALLHVIYVSDEPDQSPSAYDYVAELQAMKGAEYLLKMSAVAGPVPWGCYVDANDDGEAENSAQPGDGYYEATQETYGGFFSLCEDWGPSIETMAGFGVTRTSFPPTHLPDPATISVLVNGVRNTTDWVYMSDSNTVRFTRNVPSSGDVVDIAYVVPLECR